MARGKHARATESEDLAHEEAAVAKRIRPEAPQQAQPRQHDIPALADAPDRREVMADVARR